MIDDKQVAGVFATIVILAAIVGGAIMLTHSIFEPEPPPAKRVIVHKPPPAAPTSRPVGTPKVTPAPGSEEAQAVEWCVTHPALGTWAYFAACNERVEYDSYAVEAWCRAHPKDDDDCMAANNWVLSRGR